MTVCNVLQRYCVTRSALEFGKKIFPVVKCSGQSCCNLYLVQTCTFETCPRVECKQKAYMQLILLRMQNDRV